MPGGQEEEVSRNEARGEARREIEAEERDKKTQDDIAEIKKQLEPLSDLCKRFPEFCDGQVQTNQRLKNLEQRDPTELIVDGTRMHSHKALSPEPLEGLLKCLDGDDKDGCNCSGFTKRCSPSLAAKLTSLFLCDEKCRQKLDEMGFNIEFSKKSEYKGMLGGS